MKSCTANEVKHCELASLKKDQKKILGYILNHLRSFMKSEIGRESSLLLRTVAK